MGEKEKGRLRWAVVLQLLLFIMTSSILCFPSQTLFALICPVTWKVQSSRPLPPRSIVCVLPHVLFTFVDGRKQMNFSLNNGESIGNPTWENECSSKFMLTQHFPLKREKVGQQPLPRIELPYAMTMHNKLSNELLTSKASAADVFTQGLSSTSAENRKLHVCMSALHVSNTDSNHTCSGNEVRLYVEYPFNAF